jgi:hypothetical protein
VRLVRDVLRRLLVWLAAAHPEITDPSQLTRAHAEEFLGWLAAQRNIQTGAPLTAGHRSSVVTLLATFLADTAAWGWTDVPGRLLLTRADIPKLPQALPRYLPRPELDRLMAAVDVLPGRAPAGRAAAGAVERRSPRRVPPGSPWTAWTTTPTAIRGCGSLSARATPSG